MLNMLTAFLPRMKLKKRQKKHNTLIRNMLSVIII